MGALNVYGDTLFAHVSVGNLVEDFWTQTFVSTDQGVNWKPLSVPAGTAITGMIPYRGLLLAGTYRNGVLSTQLSLTVESAYTEERENVSMSVTTRGDEIALTVHIPESVQARITLHSLDGGQVATLFEGRMGTGVHRLPISNPSLPTGNYICRLITPSGKVASTVVPIR